jgi:hypothetical protein
MCYRDHSSSGRGLMWKTEQCPHAVYKPVFDMKICITDEAVENDDIALPKS